MRIEEVEALADKFLDEEIFQDRYYAAEFLWSGFEQTIEALRSEAWHPIERAEEMGVESGSRYLVAFARLQPDFAVYILGKWYKSGVQVETPTHFKLISPPEENYFETYHCTGSYIGNKFIGTSVGEGDGDGEYLV
jgi:hypothetical protein